MNIVILWKRGTKKIDTQVKPISPEKPHSIFNEKFQMKTQLEWDSLRNIFRKKGSDLQVHRVEPGVDVMKAATEGNSEIIGEADFDLAHYANNPHIQQDKLPLKNCTLDPNAFIEITIKTNSQEVLKTTPKSDIEPLGPGNENASPVSGKAFSNLTSRLAANQLQQIEERTSEDGFKESIDRKEYLYETEITQLKNRIEDIKRITNLTQQEISNILNQNDNSEQK